jgi:hypothetical protein
MKREGRGNCNKKKARLMRKRRRGKNIRKRKRKTHAILKSDYKIKKNA